MEQASACAARSSLSEWRTANIEDIDSPRRACTNLSRRSGKSVAGHGSSTRPLPPSSANRRGDGLGPGRSHIQDAFLDSAVGRRVASTLWLPQLLHRRRFTKAAIGVSGAIARRASAAAVSTPTCRQLKHSTITAGPVRNARSDIHKN
jgi:hypothetical protein